MKINPKETIQRKSQLQSENQEVVKQAAPPVIHGKCGKSGKQQL